ncbi:hypothetical protein [Rhizobium rhizogenes]|uniref:hypothetical protein n=1 Tax=Rhizobium rhizogenes TaxID=359 RepID=UPI0004D71824|nr:hypothetical protein [Rhizobium rhizogenes]KEA07173.1 hypothetical protein CN09_09570 [Rhizobium rhizogenes]NTI80383.1 hypothetical protein [Rhizobium rhizogenes]NTJ22569.1 hypothetical protein [Rhizobium rhizogenes]QUE81275.1 hypothetical protein EML492_05565 [Rhizobium rhizogenes]TQO80625.1 hypothetical protein FFE80_05855 [Rhizobium rhizogenes]
MNPTPEMIEAACKATILGTVDNDVPYHLEPEDARMALTAALALIPGDPEGVVVWYDPERDLDAMRPRKVIDASIGFLETAELGTKLYTSPTPHLSALANAELQSTADSRIAELEQQIANIKASRDLQVTIAVGEEERARKAETECVDLRSRLSTAYSVKADCNDEANFQRRKRIEAEVLLEEARGVLEWYASPEIYKPHPHGLAFDRRDLSSSAKSFLSKLEGSSHAEA